MFYQQTAKDDEIERLKHHVHVLEQENLSKISKVAQLEVEVKLLQQVHINILTNMSEDEPFSQL